MDGEPAREQLLDSADLQELVAAEEDPGARILLVFDSLEAWYRQPEFRGCAFINAFGELGAA